MAPIDCTAQGGMPAGMGSDCANTECPVLDNPCPIIPGIQECDCPLTRTAFLTGTVTFQPSGDLLCNVSTSIELTNQDPLFSCSWGAGFGFKEDCNPEQFPGWHVAGAGFQCNTSGAFPNQTHFFSGSWSFGSPDNIPGTACISIGFSTEITMSPCSPGAFTGPDSASGACGLPGAGSIRITNPTLSVS